MPLTLARIFPLALLGILAVLPSAVGSRPVSVQDQNFPSATEPLNIPGPEDAAWTVKDLLDEYCRVTDQVFVCDSETMALLEQSQLGVSTGLDVHPNAVNSVVERALESA